MTSYHVRTRRGREVAYTRQDFEVFDAIARVFPEVDGDGCYALAIRVTDDAHAKAVEAFALWNAGPFVEGEQQGDRP